MAPGDRDGASLTNRTSGTAGNSSSASADERMDTGTVSEKPWISPSDKRIARDAARQGDKVRREAIEKAMRAGWADQDVDVSNWLDEAARAHPGPDSAVRVLYGVTQRLIDRLAEETGDDRERILREALR